MTSAIAAQAANNPRVGMLATVRNRRTLVTSVEPFDAGEGRLHLVQLEYTDHDGVSEDQVIWELEPHATLLEPTALPQVERVPPMPASDFLALQRAARWTAMSPFIFPDGHAPATRLPIASPFFGAVQVEDFQLVPLLKALRMPRISLLLADDVGLGKTVESGLILAELILRRRIRRVLILSPAALRQQWRQEMKSKFSLSFDVVDRAETHAMQKRMGLDANPWRTFPRIITSYHYLKQPDVLQQFLAVCRRQHDGSPHLPWDLLIVDEAHNLMPANFGQDSDLSQMLRIISPFFEHKLFLTATPHNGHTRCFSGLLEQLDPVRFTQTSEFTDETRSRIGEVVVRRLKRDINAYDRQQGRSPRFAERLLEPLPLYFGIGEKQLFAAFQAFRSAVKSLIAQSRRSEQLAGSFAVEVLNKRLLSCPVSFSDSWRRFREGLTVEAEADAADVQAAKRSVQEDLDDDREVEGRVGHAARVSGAWLKPLAPHLTQEVANVDQALDRLGLLKVDEGQVPTPSDDARWDRLVTLIRQRLREGTGWSEDERLVIFTEYKTTLDYLERRLKATFGDDGAIRVLYGGLDDRVREEIKRSFNDPNDKVRILVATDAASEGLNLQETARLLHHYDIPWNPSRLDQRNGRLDRHGQARDVVIFHFTSEDEADLKFLAHVMEKVNAIREDLGSMGEIFDAAFEQRFNDQADFDHIRQSLDAAVDKRRDRARVPHIDPSVDAGAEAESLEWFAKELDLTPQSLTTTLETAMGLGFGMPRFDGPDEAGRLRLRLPVPPRWEGLIDDSLRIEMPSGQRGALPSLVFDPNSFIQVRNGRPVFRAAKDAVLMHLGHPLFHQALSLFARARFPGALEDQVATSRWTVRYGSVPAGADALLLLTVEELAINELREPFHHWVKTIHVPIIRGDLGDPLPHLPAGSDATSDRVPDEQAINRARDLWEEVVPEAKDLMRQLSVDLAKALESQLKESGKAAIDEAKERFKGRIKEVEKAKADNTLSRLEKERNNLLTDMQQLSLFAEFTRQQEDKLRNLDEELRYRQEHYDKLLEQLHEEQDRVIKRLLPNRYKLRGGAQVFPVTVEIRLPEVVQ